jgi:hypothetical protein
MGGVFQTLTEPPSSPTANRQSRGGLETLSKSCPVAASMAASAWVLLWTSAPITIVQPVPSIDGFSLTGLSADRPFLGAVATLLSGHAAGLWVVADDTTDVRSGPRADRQATSQLVTSPGSNPADRTTTANGTFLPAARPASRSLRQKPAPRFPEQAPVPGRLAASCSYVKRSSEIARKCLLAIRCLALYPVRARASASSVLVVLRLLGAAPPA